VNYEVTAPTEDDMEAYRLLQMHTHDDPMAKFMQEKKKKK
jgi:hypothetical protein